MILPVIRAGKTATIIWQLWNPAPPGGGAPILYDPPQLPAITIIDPNGAQQVQAAAMTRMSVGQYRYDYPTLSAGVLGVWSMWVDAQDALGNPSGSAYQGTPPTKATPAFTLV